VNAGLALEVLEDRTVLSVAHPFLSSSYDQLTISAFPNDSRIVDQWAIKNTAQGGVGKTGADTRVTRAWDVTTGSSKLIVSVQDTGVDYTHPDLYLNIWLNQGEIPASRRNNLRDYNGDGLITFRDLNDPRNKGLGKIADLNGNGYIDAGDVLKPMVKDALGRDTGKGGWADRISNNGDGFIDDLAGWNFVNNNNNPMDDFGHGTHVAGTIGAVGNNGIGVSGIAWNVQLMPIKFLSSTGNGNVNAFIAGLNYAVAHGAKISNNSWTGANFSTPLMDAIESARDRGHIFVAAAGNYDSDNDKYPNYPSSFQIDNIVSVAATDRNDTLASFSNYGARSVDLAAPGVDILSTTLKGGYGFNSGTSMATPHVTGVMALVWSVHPTWTYKQVITQVLTTVDKLPALTGKTSTGGRVNAAAAVGSAQIASTPPRIVSAVPGGPAANTLSKVRVTFDRAVNPTTFSGADVRLTTPTSKVIPISSVKVVAGTGERTYEITFATQYAAGSYAMRIGPEVMDRAGVKMAIWTGSFRINTVKPVVTKTYTQSAKTAILPRGHSVSLLTISDNIAISDVNVRLSITHPRLSDLYIHLQAPDGTNIVLFNRMGGSSANMVNTVFDDQASVHIALGRAPFTGSFQPTVALSNLANKSAKGTWKLWVVDRGGVNRGTIENWSLIVKPKAV
jgi:subtilisin family serine protease/subtilisin-like proprotein convertase family protein